MKIPILDGLGRFTNSILSGLFDKGYIYYIMVVFIIIFVLILIGRL